MLAVQLRCFRGLGGRGKETKGWGPRSSCEKFLNKGEAQGRDGRSELLHGTKDPRGPQDARGAPGEDALFSPRVPSCKDGAVPGQWRRRRRQKTPVLAKGLVIGLPPLRASSRAQRYVNAPSFPWLRIGVPGPLRCAIQYGYVGGLVPWHT